MKPNHSNEGAPYPGAPLNHKEEEAMVMERITETFRGVHCKRAAREWKNRMALDGWREETFSGVSGLGGYKTCSMTLVRAAAAPLIPPAVVGSFCPTCGAPARNS